MELYRTGQTQVRPWGPKTVLEQFRGFCSSVPHVHRRDIHFRQDGRWQRAEPWSRMLRRDGQRFRVDTQQAITTAYFADVDNG